MGTVTPSLEAVPQRIPWYRSHRFRTALWLFLIFLPVIVSVHVYIYVTFLNGNIQGLRNRAGQVFEVSLEDVGRRLALQDYLLDSVAHEPAFQKDLAALPQTDPDSVHFQRLRARLVSALVTGVMGPHQEALWVRDVVIVDEEGRIWLATQEAWEQKRLSPELVEAIKASTATHDLANGQGEAIQGILWGQEAPLGFQKPWIALVNRVQDAQGTTWWMLGAIPPEGVQEWMASFRVLGGAPVLVTRTQEGFILEDEWQIWTPEQVRNRLLNVPLADSDWVFLFQLWSKKPVRRVFRPPNSYHPTEDHGHWMIYLPEGGGQVWVLLPFALVQGESYIGIRYNLASTIGPLVSQVVRGLVLQATVVALFLWVIAWWLGGRVTRPLQAMIKGVQALAEGRWDTRIPTRGQDEFALLAQVFNQMAARLEGLYRSLEDEVRRRTYQVSLLMEWLTLDAPHDTWTYQAFLEGMVWGLRETLPSGVYPVLVLWNDDLQDMDWRVAPDFPEGATVSLRIERAWVREALRKKTPLFYTAESHNQQVPPPFQTVWVAPLVQRERPMGALILYSTQAQVFTEEFQNQLREMLPTLVSGLVFAQATWLRIHLHTLVQVTIHLVQGVSDRGDLMDIFFAVGRILERYFPRSIFLVRQGTSNIWQPLYPATLAGRRVETLIPLSKEQRWLLIPDLEALRAVQQLPKEIRDLTQELEWKGTILIPVWTQDRLLALLLLGMEWPGEYPQEMLHVLHLATLLLGLLLDRAEVQDRLRLWEVLMTFFLKATEAPTLGQALDVLVGLLRQNLTENGDYFFVFGDETGTIHDAFVFLEGQAQYHLVLSPVDRALAQQVLKTGEPRVFNEASEVREVLAEYPALMQGPIPQSWVGMPIQVGGRIVGVWGLRDAHQAYRFDAEFLSRMQTLTEYLGPVLAYLLRMQRYEQRLQREEWVHTLGLHLISLWDPQVLTQEAAGELQRIFRAQRVRFRLHVPTVLDTARERVQDMGRAEGAAETEGGASA